MPPLTRLRSVTFTYLLFLNRASGLKALWRGKKFEDRYTQVALGLWENVEASHAFSQARRMASFTRLSSLL